jgi:hypothetical protein
MAHAISEQAHGRQQMLLAGFGTFLQARGAPEMVLERARSFGHVALVLASRCAEPGNDNRNGYGDCEGRREDPFGG